MAQIRLNGEVLDKVYISNAGELGSAPAYGGDVRGFSRTILAPNNTFITKRIPTTTAGVFLNDGDRNIAPNKTAGAKGDIITKITAEVKSVANGGKAGLFVTQLSDPIFGMGVAGAAIVAGNSVTLTAGDIFPATANLLADRVVSIFYKPDNTPTGAAHWFTTRIVSHAAISTTSIVLTLEDAIEAGAAPTKWIVHGVLARRLIEPGRTPREEPYVIEVNMTSQAGGFVGWTGSGLANVVWDGEFTG